MIKIGVLAKARQRHGGTLLYTLSMLDALARLPKTDFQLMVFAEPNNQEYAALGLSIVAAPGMLKLIASRLLRRNPYAAVDFVLAPVYSSALLACGKPFAFTLHDLQERHYPENFSLITRCWRRVVNGLLASRAQRIICESEFVRSDIIRYIGVSEQKIEVIPAPPIAMLRDANTDDSAIATVRAKFSLPESYIFYPAQFWQHKNHRRLIDAFALVLRNHPDCVLVLTGKKRDEYERVFARVSELGLTTNVRHIGYVAQSELAALYKGATVAVIPTLFESISIPIYEAFSIGTAVCASNVVAIPEQVGDAGLLFDPNSVEDIANKINTLLSNSVLRAQLIKNGHRRMQFVTHNEYAIRLSDLIAKVFLCKN